MQLWNTRTWYVDPVQHSTDVNFSSLIHSFPHPTPAAPSAITALTQSPAIDVVGVGYLDGTVRVYDIRQGELVMQVKMDEGSITAVSFRMGELRLCSCWMISVL